MSLPADWKLIPVRGRYVGRDGTPCVGSVKFTSTQTVRIAQTLVVPESIVVQLDTNGAFEVMLPATDDPDLSVTGWAYVVTESFPGKRAPFLLSVPQASSSIDLTGASPLPPVGPFVDHAQYVGPAGPPGPAGADGDPGPQGPQGPAGNGIRVDGQVASYANLPVSASNGEIYLTVDTGRLYRYDNGAWPAEVDGIQLRGPEGLQGPQGPQGPAGADGVDGIQGIQGPDGPQGPQGDQGLQGIQGPDGPQGLQGDAGPSAYDAAVQGGFVGTEAQWLASLVGPQGDQGVQGIQGIQGPDGPQGPQGDQGLQGIQGPDGPQGDQGLQGLQGIQGVQGDTGLQGLQGSDAVWTQITQAAYDALSPPDAGTLYIVIG